MLMPKEAKMITHAELQQLIDFEPTGHPVLSLYLNVDPSRRSKDKYMLWLRNHLKEVSDQADQADIERVERYFGFEYDWQGKSVASFACAEAGLWQAFPLAVPIEDGIFVSDLPRIKPLTDLMDRYESYGVALVDREGSRLFQIHMGQIVGTAGTLGEETKRHKQGGWAAQKLQRHEDVQASHNLRSAANAAMDFFQQGQSRRIILAGTEETVSQFHNLLPRAWQEKVVGTLPMDMNAPDTEVLSKSWAIIDKAHADEQTALVERIITSAAKSEGAAVGLSATLASLQEERAHILVIAEGFDAPGYRCTQCGNMTAVQEDACPYCGGEMVYVDDAVEYAVKRMLELGGRVESVRDAPALVEAGSIGVLLRY
jgi:peptide chain release factor subunit 1